MIRSYSIQDFDDLKMFIEIEFKIFENIFCIWIIVKHRFVEKSVLDISSTLNYQQFFIKDLSSIDIVFSINYILNFWFNLFYFMIVLKILWKKFKLLLLYFLLNF